MGQLNRAENGAQTQLSQTLQQQTTQQQKTQQVAIRGLYSSFGTTNFFGHNGAANVQIIDEQGSAPTSVNPDDSARPRPEVAVQKRSAESVASHGATASVRAPNQTTPDVQLTVANKLKLMGIPVVNVVPNKQVVILFNDKEVKLVKRSATGVGVNLPPESARLLHDTLSLHKLSFLDLVSELTLNDVSRVARPKSSWLGGIFR